MNAIAAAAASQNPPKLDFLFQMNLTLDSIISTGPGSQGTRVAVPITGGYITGPKANGTILPVGADFGVFDALGRFNVDSHSVLHMDDGSYVYAHSVGPAVSGAIGMDRIKFETGAESFSWLNEILAVAVTDFPGPWVSLKRSGDQEDMNIDDSDAENIVMQEVGDDGGNTNQ
ncbi:hypothetical protein MBLNU13_g10318t3 [Cladosporium sp. NU13]